MLPAAVVAGLSAISATGSARAVHVNPEGLGQVLFYPYYTVQDNFVTALSIINTTSLTKAVKVRFLEGKNGREVLDFNLFLAPTDVWTGVVLPTDTGAKLETGDNSCVTPSDLFGNAAGQVRADGDGLPLNSFKTYQFTGANVDFANFSALDRTREGYIEVFEMGTVTDATLQGLIRHARSGATTGQPANCAALDGYDGLSSAALPAVKFPGNYLTSPGGGLTGRASIINVANGTNYTYDVTALDGWWAPLVPGPGNVPYSAAGAITPSISTQAGISTVSYVLSGNPTVPNSIGVLRAVWASPREAVSAVLMHDSIINEFLNDAGTVSKTDWVITMPTKRDHIGVGAGIPSRPFSNNFSNTSTAGACETYRLRMFNRELGTLSSSPGTINIGLPPPVATPIPIALCYGVNVIELGATGLLRSHNNFRLLNGFDMFGSITATTTGAGFATLSRRTIQGPNGWLSIGFGAFGDAAQTQQSITPLSATLNGVAVNGTHFGLPVIGAMFHNYTNTGVASAYGGVIPHKYSRNADVIPAVP